MFNYAANILRRFSRAEILNLFLFPAHLTACAFPLARPILPSPVPLTWCGYGHRFRERSIPQNRPDQRPSIPFGHPQKPKTTRIFKTHHLYEKARLWLAKRNRRPARAGVNGTREPARAGGIGKVRWLEKTGVNETRKPARAGVCEKVIFFRKPTDYMRDCGKFDGADGRRNEKWEWVDPCFMQCLEALSPRVGTPRQ